MSPASNKGLLFHRLPEHFVKPRAVPDIWSQYGGEAFRLSPICDQDLASATACDVVAGVRNHRDCPVARISEAISGVTRTARENPDVASLIRAS
ncbi:hypothetical protein BRAS3809_7710011 [Bradyrhizobium sp. STM 3809]|nr:hypothetical protein BRAS3809_7710011 [Bradyrhizobium sp. STM 3809]